MIAQLLGVHLAEALEALDRVVADPLAVLLAQLDQRVALAVRVRVLEVVPAPLDLVQRGTGQEHVPGLDQRPHEAEQEGQQQGVDVLAVDVGVRHQDDLVIAELLDVEVLVDPGAEGRDQRLDLLVLQDLVDPRLLDVQDLAADREDRLVLRVAAGLGRAAGGVTLDDEDLALGGVVRLAVGQLARQRRRLQQALAAGQVTGLAGRHARGGRLDAPCG